MRQRAANKAAFKARLMQAVADGKLTAAEIVELDNLKEQYGLTADDLRGVRLGAYLQAYQGAKSHGAITEEEEKELGTIQAYLGVEDTEIQTSKMELARYRLLREIHAGNIPAVPVSGLVFQKNEVAYWVESASLLEERVVSRRYEGGYQGVSIRIARGLSYRVGGSKGHLISETGIVPVSTGELIITSKRVVFRGDRKGFNTRLDKLLDVHLFADGVRLTDGNGKPRTFHFSSSNNAEVFGALLSHAINRFSGGSANGAA